MPPCLESDYACWRIPLVCKVLITTAVKKLKDAIFDGEKPSTVVWRSLNNNLKELVEIQVNIKHDGLQRIGEVPQYESDPIVRRSAPLQKTKYNIKPMARMCADAYA